MASIQLRRAATAGLLASSFVLTAPPALAGDTYTREFRGEGSSSFGFAWEYARAHAARQARDDGFTEPREQCAETSSWGNIYWAWVYWTCSREA